jgi:hypothetical protein
MWIAVELALHHYDIDELEPGMWFMNHLYPGHEDRELVEVWELSEEATINDKEILFMESGFPVQPFLVDEEGSVIVTPDEIGWWDAGDIAEELIPFGINEVNFILREFDGLLEMFVDEDALEEGFIEPILENDLVILRFLTDDDGEQEQLLNI